jgi:hypothetical protein
VRRHADAAGPGAHLRAQQVNAARSPLPETSPTAPAPAPPLRGLPRPRRAAPRRSARRPRARRARGRRPHRRAWLVFVGTVAFRFAFLAEALMGLVDPHLRRALARPQRLRARGRRRAWGRAAGRRPRDRARGRGSPRGPGPGARGRLLRARTSP